jgi:uncharacterized protein YbjT (DUF2867 family)
MTTTSSKTSVIIGGTGKTGRRVAARLIEMGVPVRATSRTGEHTFDWDDETTWSPALRDAGAVYLTYAPDLGLPGAADRVRELAALAADSGVRRLVLFSGRGQHNHEPAERAVQESGLEWTIVRSAWLAQNFSEDFLAPMVGAGVLALPAGDAVIPFIDADDVADVAVAALTEAGHHGEIYEVTGPRSLGFAEAAEEIARATSRPLGYLAVDDHEYASGMAEEGVPPDLAAVLSEIFVELRTGESAHPTDAVQRALGRPPRDFTAFVRAAAGSWTQDSRSAE